MNATKRRRFLRRARWLFGNSGIISLGLEHFLAMVPATILVPIMVNNTVGATVVDLSLVLFTSGIGTIIFALASRGRIPAYLGSSFAYIGLTIYLIESQMGTGVAPQMAYSYVGWSYVFSGILLVALSFLYRWKNADRLLSFLLPASVAGPAISLIGFELADTAILDAGFNVATGTLDGTSAVVAISTLCAIIFCSLLKNKRMKNGAILIGMLVGFCVYFGVNGLPDLNLSAKNIFAITPPKFDFPLRYFPQNWLHLLISVIPATLIIFAENLGRVTVIDRMVRKDVTEEGMYNEHTIKQLHKGLLSHGISAIAVTLMGSVPNTVYAENIAIMGIHSDEAKEDPDKVISDFTRPCSVYPYFAAAFIAILFSFVGILQEFIISIPKPIIGGMELFLFGIISAPGIQLLVEQRVNYKKISNQVITAAVLISGVSGLAVNLGVVELKGMSLGFVVGIMLNLFVQLLKWLGTTGDTVDFDELVEECLTAAIPRGSASTASYRVAFKAEGRMLCEMRADDLQIAFRNAGARVTVNLESETGEWAIDTLRHSSLLEFKCGSDVVFTVKKTANGLFIDFVASKIDDETGSIYLNDYPDAIDADAEFLHVDVARSIPMRKVRELVRISSASIAETDAQPTAQETAQ